jgi:hypothetical protein
LEAQAQRTYGSEKVQERQVGKALANALRSLDSLSKDYIKAGQQHDNPEFLWIGKGMHYGVEHIKESVKKELGL